MVKHQDVAIAYFTGRASRPSMKECQPFQFVEGHFSEVWCLNRIRNFPYLVVKEPMYFEYKIKYFCIVFSTRNAA